MGTVRNVATSTLLACSCALGVGQQPAKLTRVSAPLVGGAAAPAQGSTAEQQARLRQTVEKMDAASKRFKSALAQFHRVFHDRLTGDEAQDGEIYFHGEGKSADIGMKTEGNDGAIVHFRDGRLLYYAERTKVCKVVSKPGVETYLTLGFGGSGTDLVQAWDVTDLGPETIDGVATEKLQLLPKKGSPVANNISKFTLWVDLSRDVSLKQVLVDPSDNTQTATYTITRFNQDFSTKPFSFSEKNCQ